MYKLWFINQFIVFSLYLYRGIKKTLRLDPKTDTPHRLHIDSTQILRRYVEDQISTNFYVISAYFFNVISTVEKFTLFPRTFYEVISMVEICTWFLLTFF